MSGEPRSRNRALLAADLATAARQRSRQRRPRSCHSGHVHDDPKFQAQYCIEAKVIKRAHVVVMVLGISAIKEIRNTCEKLCWQNNTMSAWHHCIVSCCLPDIIVHLCQCCENAPEQLHQEPEYMNGTEGRQLRQFLLRAAAGIADLHRQCRVHLSIPMHPNSWHAPAQTLSIACIVFGSTLFAGTVRRRVAPLGHTVYLCSCRDHHTSLWDCFEKGISLQMTEAQRAWQTLIRKGSN